MIEYSLISEKQRRQEAEKSAEYDSLSKVSIFM